MYIGITDINLNGKITAIPVKPSIRDKLDKLVKERGGKDKPTPTKKPPDREL